MALFSCLSGKNEGTQQQKKSSNFHQACLDCRWQAGFILRMFFFRSVYCGSRAIEVTRIIKDTPPYGTCIAGIRLEEADCIKFTGSLGGLGDVLICLNRGDYCAHF